MDIGQSGNLESVHVQDPGASFKPFARPRLKRRRVTPSKPPVFAVRANPSHYVLDLSENSRSTERVVLSLVLSDKRGISVVGLPGSGKSVILRGVAYHPSIFSTFRDGVCFVQLGSETSSQTLFDHFFEVMVKLGGSVEKVRVEECLKQTRHQTKAMEMIMRFLKEKRLLLILDDVSENTPEILRLLSVFVTTRPTRGRGRFTVLSSTRSEDVARTCSDSSILHVDLQDACGERSRDILCAHAGFDRTYFDSECAKPKNPIVPVLQKCSGLPLALAVAGGAVKRLLKTAPSSDGKALIWSHYKTYLVDNFDQFGEISGLFKAFQTCMDSMGKTQDWKVSISITEVVCALGIVPNGVWIPSIVLQKVWGVQRDEMVTILRALLRLCLVSRHSSRTGSVVFVPDIVLDFCRHIAKNASGIHKWHIKLLKLYVAGAGIDVNGSAIRKPVQSDTTIDEAHYLQRFLVYHLEQTEAHTPQGERKKIESLLSSAKART